jgi:hypothetical protein
VDPVSVAVPVHTPLPFFFFFLKKNSSGNMLPAALPSPAQPRYHFNSTQLQWAGEHWIL